MKSISIRLLVILAVALVAGCGNKAEVVTAAKPVVAVAPAPKPVVAVVAAVKAPVPEPAASAAVLPAVFKRPDLTLVMSPLTLDVSDEQLFANVLEFGYDSKLDALAANAFNNSGSKWAQLAAAIRNGKPDPEIAKLTTKPWTKPISYLRVGKRTVVFVALVKGMTPTSGFELVRQLMVVVAGLDENDQPLVVSASQIPYVDTADIHAPSLSSVRPSLNLNLNEFIDLRSKIAVALRT